MAKVTKWNEVLRQNEEFDVLTVEEKENHYQELEMKRKERIRNLPRFIFGALAFLPVYPLIFCLIGVVMLIDLFSAITQPNSRSHIGNYRGIASKAFNLCLWGDMDPRHAFVILSTSAMNPLLFFIAEPSGRYLIGLVSAVLIFFSYVHAEETRRYDARMSKYGRR